MCGSPYSFKFSMHHLCLQSTTETSSIDQQEAVKGEADVIREEARKGSTGETVNYVSYVCLK